MYSSITDRKKALIEIILCFFLTPFFMFLTSLAEIFLHLNSYLAGVCTYLLSAGSLVFYMVKTEKSPLSSIGLKPFSPGDIPKGLLLGLAMFTAQQIPLLLIKADYSAFAMEPDPGYMIGTTLYCFFCVGFTEELLFRGFIFHRTLSLCSSRTVAVGINILLFYIIHFASLTFAFGEVYNISVNVLFLCIYFLCSQRKSLIPLMIAHGFYDTLTSVLLPVFLFLLGK